MTHGFLHASRLMWPPCPPLSLSLSLLHSQTHTDTHTPPCPPLSLSVLHTHTPPCPPLSLSLSLSLPLPFTHTPPCSPSHTRLQLSLTPPTHTHTPSFCLSLSMG